MLLTDRPAWWLTEGRRSMAIAHQTKVQVSLKTELDSMLVVKIWFLFMISKMYIQQQRLLLADDRWRHLNTATRGMIKCVGGSTIHKQAFLLVRDTHFNLSKVSISSSQKWAFELVRNEHLNWSETFQEVKNEHYQHSRNANFFIKLIMVANALSVVPQELNRN